MMIAGRESGSHGSRGFARPWTFASARATRIFAFTLIATALAILPARLARAQKAIVSAQFAGGARPGAVFDDRGFFDAARRCAQRSSAANHEDAERGQTDCLADYMKRRHASPQAIAFMKLAPVPAAIHEIRHYGAVSVVHARMMWADGSDGWALIGDSGEVVPLWTPPAIEGDPRFRRFLERHRDASLWSDSISWPRGRPIDSGGESLRFRFGLKTCHACARIGEAVVRYDFGAHGKFLGAHLVRIEETPEPGNPG